MKIDNKKDFKNQAILFSGPPASGKGTQCQILKELYDLIHVNVGNELRNKRREDTEIGNYIDKNFNRRTLTELGLEIEDKLILEAGEKGKGLLFESSPNFVSSIPRLEKILEKSSFEIKAFIEFDVGDERGILEERASGRIEDDNGNVFHAKFNPPPNQKSEGNVLKRKDDEEENHIRRVETFYQNMPLIRKYFKTVGKYHVVDARKSIEEVTSDIEEIFSKCKDTKHNKETVFKSKNFILTESNNVHLDKIVSKLDFEESYFLKKKLFEKLNLEEINHISFFGKVPAVLDLKSQSMDSSDLFFFLQADGMRFFSCFYNGSVYFVNTSLKLFQLDQKLIEENNSTSFVNSLNETILDGEVVFLKEKSVLKFVVFDILVCKGENVCGKTLLERFSSLEKNFDKKIEIENKRLQL
eukprot:TRINITY_DN8137_c0_g1_i1.p1 TRINITY_DN8137_c0_g1~~TRINITY_DN8137_c0_g1_i1.p1  ORF type:complete len:433 (-),score=133.34 TRINITY_DN8137_c0_g1_i1:727-1965(-)